MERGSVLTSKSSWAWYEVQTFQEVKCCGQWLQEDNPSMLHNVHGVFDQKDNTVQNKTKATKNELENTVCLFLKLFSDQFYMTIHIFLALDVWGVFFPSLKEHERKWFLPLSQRGNIYIVPHDVTRKSCVEKKLQKKEGEHVACLCFPKLPLLHPENQLK